MDYYQTITAHLLGEAQAIKSIRADDASALPKVVVSKLRQAFPSNGQLRAINPEDILAVVNIKTCRMLKLTGKVWNQLSSGDEIWLVTPKEWKEHSEKVLIHECKIRHGKKLMIRNPTALSPKQLYDMVELYFPNIEKKFTELVSPVSTPPPKLKPSSAVKEKAPFLKAHKGSPNKNGALSYSERRKNLVSSPVAGDAPDAAVGSREEASPSPTGKRKLSPSHLAVSNREQTVLPPMSPTLLRRVGLGRNLEMIPAESEEGAFPAPLDDEQQEEEEEERSEGTNGTPPRVLVDLAKAAEDVAAEEHKQEASAREEEESNRQREDDDDSLNSNSAGQWSDVNIVGDDATLATLTTFTNSVANSGIVSSVHDVSTTPGNTMYGYESRRGRTGPASGALVVEIDLEDLLSTPAAVQNDAEVDEAVAAGINLGQEDFYYELDSAGDSDSHSEDGPPRSPLSSASSSPEQEQEDLSPVTPLAVSPSHVHSFSFGPTAENVMVMESLDDEDLGVSARPHAEVAYIHPPRAERRRVRMEFNPQYDEFNENTHLRGTPSEDSPSPYQGSHREWSEMEDIMSVGDVSALSELSVNSGFVNHPLLFQTTRPHSLPALVVEGEEELESHDSDSAVLVPVGTTAEEEGAGGGEEEYTMGDDLVDDSDPVPSAVAEKSAADDDDCVDASIVPVADPLEDQSLATDMPLSAPSSPRAYTTEASSIAPSSVGGTVVEDDNMDMSMVPIAGSHEDQSIVTEVPLAQDQDQDSASVVHTAVGPDVDATTSVEEDSMDVSMVPVVDSLEDQSILTEMPPPTSAEVSSNLDEVLLTSGENLAELGAEGEDVEVGVNDDDCLDASMVHVVDSLEEQSILTEIPPALSSASADFGAAVAADEPLEGQLQPTEELEADLVADDCAEISILPVADPLHDDFSIATELPASSVTGLVDETAQTSLSDTGVDGPLQEEHVVTDDAVLLSEVPVVLSILLDEVHTAAVHDRQEPVHLDVSNDPGLSPRAGVPTPAFADTISTLSGRSQGELELEIGSDGEEEQGDADGYAPTAEEATPSELSAESQARSEENDTVATEATEPNASSRPADHSHNTYGIALVAEELPEVDEGEVPLPAYDGAAEADSSLGFEPEEENEVTAFDNTSSVEVPAEYDIEGFEVGTTPAVEDVLVTIVAVKSVVEPEVIAVMDAVVDAVVDVDADLHYSDDCEASEEDEEEVEEDGAASFEVPVAGDGIVYDADFNNEEVPLVEGYAERTATTSSDAADVEGDVDQSFDDDLIFSADQVHHSALNAPAYPLYPLGLSDSLESEAVPETSEALLPESTTQLAVAAPIEVPQVEDVAADSESALDALFDSLAGELSHLSEEFHHSHDFSLSHPTETVSLEVSPVDHAPHTPHKAVTATASADFDEAHSPLMASTSLLITLSPDRELEHSSLFIRSPGTPEDSAASSSEQEGGANSNNDSQGSETESEVSEGGEEEVEVDSPVAPPPSEDITPVIAKQENLTVEVTSPGAHESGQVVTASSTEDSTSPRVAPETPSSVLSTEVALELQVKVQRQAEELAEASRVKAALEARLDETRQLLQIFAAGRAVPLGTTDSPTSRSKLGNHSTVQLGLVGSPPSYQGDIDLDALENTLKSDSVQSIAAEGLHHISHLGGGPASSSKMRKSLRRLLERKREEKSRGNGSPRASAKTLARSGDEGGGEESSPTVPHLPKQRARPGKRADDESSDSGFSSDARSLPSLPPSAYSSPRTHRKGGISVEAAKRSRNSSNDSQESALSKLPPKGAQGGSIGIADHLVSVDELEMEVKYVQGLVYRGTETITSPVRPTLDLSDFYSSQSQSSDAHSRSFSERGPAVELTEAINALRQGDNSPPPPPPPQQVPEHASEDASGPLESSGGLRPSFGLNLNMSEDSMPPKNAHILSPRHLNVQVSSSSDDELSQVSLRSFTLPKTPPATVFSPLNSQQSLKTASTSPKVPMEAAEDAARSPLTLPDGRSIESFNPADADSAQVSEGDSSVESNNPLLLESTPKIRGLGRPRPMQPPSSVPLYLGANNTSVQFSDVPEVVEYDRLHGHFFHDDVGQKPREASPPRRAAPSMMLPGEGLVKPAETTTFMYNYDTYHAMRPDLFLDSGPNSPFNPHSPFLHHAAGSSGTVSGGQKLTIMGQLEEQRCAAELSARIGKEEMCSSPQRVLMETHANTVANAGITSNLTAILRSTRAATPTRSATPSSAEKVKFSESPIITAVELDIPTEQPERAKAGSPVVMSPPASALTPPSVKPEEPRTPSPVTPPLSKPVTPVPVLAAHSPPPPPRPSSIPVSAAKATPAGSAPDTPVDKLAALFAYSLPLLVTARYMENTSLRGMAGRQEIARTTGPRDLLSWCVFQAYGTPDGAIVKGIKMIQVVRALKDAEVCTSITTSQLDLLLTKINLSTKAAASPVPSGVLAANVHVHPSLLSTSRVLKKTTATSQGAVSGTGSAGNSSKGEQNSNSLAGASFSTFCALMSAIAGILFSSDVKVRQRAQKKGVTLGDLTSWSSTPNEEREISFVQMDRHWRRLLEKRDSLEAVKVLQEVQTSASGILQRTSYLRPSPGRAQGSIGALAGSVWAVGGGVRQFSEAELEAVRQVWDRNSDQIRQIYGFYATSKEPRRQGSGPSKLLVSFEHCREALVDFQVLPHVVDAQGYARLFKVCKMWELEVVEQLLLAQEAGHANGDTEEHAGEDAISSPLSSAKKDRGLFIRIDSFSKPVQMMLSSPGGGSGGAQESVAGGARATDDPLDLRGSVGNLCLSLSGFMELLTRIALGQQKLGARPQEALENLMHIMDASDGKAKLIRASRKSTSVRHFVYGVK